MSDLKLCFDFDDTLYDVSIPFKKTMRHFFCDAFVSDQKMEELYKEYRAMGEDFFDLLQEGIIFPDDSGIVRIFKLCQKHNFDLNVLEAADFQDFYKSVQLETRPFEKLAAFLQSFQGDLAVITNGADDHQRRKIHALGMDQIFPASQIFTSGQLGYRKPDLRCFQKAFSEMGKDCTGWIYIGDNYENDMEGAKAAGMKTIHFNHHHNREGNQSDFVVYTEEELVRLLRSLENNIDKI